MRHMDLRVQTLRHQENLVSRLGVVARRQIEEATGKRDGVQERLRELYSDAAPGCYCVMNPRRLLNSERRCWPLVLNGDDGSVDMNLTGNGPAARIIPVVALRARPHSRNQDRVVLDQNLGLLIPK